MVTTPPPYPDTTDPATFRGRLGPFFDWLVDAVAHIVGLDYSGRLLSNATYGGTADAIEITTGTALPNLSIGQRIEFLATAVNTGATTIDIDGTGPVAAVTVTGAALPANYIRTDARTVCYFDGTNIVVERETEYGSNANGSWRRYDDGRQVCEHRLTGRGPIITPETNGFYSGGFAWTFPAQFIAVPSVVASAQRQNAAPPGVWTSRREASTTSQAMLLHSNASLNVTDINVDVEAVGDWY